jgi:hypothetical protein
MKILNKYTYGKYIGMKSVNGGFETVKGTILAMGSRRWALGEF